MRAGGGRGGSEIRGLCTKNGAKTFPLYSAFNSPPPEELLMDLGEGGGSKEGRVTLLLTFSRFKHKPGQVSSPACARGLTETVG